jgi:hypothetical protein
VPASRREKLHEKHADQPRQNPPPSATNALTCKQRKQLQTPRANFRRLCA